MKKCVLIFLLVAISACAQQTPAQIEVNSAAFNSFSQRQLAQANTYLLALLIGGASLTPAQIMGLDSSFNTYSDRQLQQAQTYLLSLIQSGPVTPYSTNFVKANSAASLISAVNVNAVAGQTIYITPGTYNIGTNILVVPDNVNLIGAGHDQVNIIGFADCSAHESGTGAPTGGPQIHPGNNCIIGGFTVTCDTNSMVPLIPTTHSGTWAAIGCSYLNPPTTTPFTNCLWKDIWGFEGYFDVFHINSSNRCEVRIEDCRGEAQGGINNFVSAISSSPFCRTNTVRMDRCTFITHGAFPPTVAAAGMSSSYIYSFDSVYYANNCTGINASNVAGSIFAPWSGSTSNLMVLNGGYYYTPSTTDTTWNASSVVGNFVFGTLNTYPTNVYKSVPFNYPVAANTGIASLQANKASLITSNIVTTTWVFTNTLAYNIQVFCSGAGGGSNSMAINGTFVGYMTNGLTAILQPNETFAVTNGAAHPNFSFKPF